MKLYSRKEQTKNDILETSKIVFKKRLQKEICHDKFPPFNDVCFAVNPI